MKRLMFKMVVMSMLLIMGMSFTGCTLHQNGGTNVFPTTVPTSVYVSQVKPLVQVLMAYQGSKIDPTMKAALTAAMANLDAQAASGSTTVDIPTALVPVVISLIEVNSGAINLKPQDAALALVALEFIHYNFGTNAFEEALYPIVKTILTDLANKQPAALKTFKLVNKK